MRSLLIVVPSLVPSPVRLRRCLRHSLVRWPWWAACGRSNSETRAEWNGPQMQSCAPRRCASKDVVVGRMPGMYLLPRPSRAAYGFVPREAGETKQFHVHRCPVGRWARGRTGGPSVRLEQVHDGPVRRDSDHLELDLSMASSGMHEPGSVAAADERAQRHERPAGVAAVRRVVRRRDRSRWPLASAAPHWRRPMAAKRRARGLCPSFRPSPVSFPFPSSSLSSPCSWPG